MVIARLKPSHFFRSEGRLTFLGRIRLSGLRLTGWVLLWAYKLMLLYRQIGQDILARQAAQGWAGLGWGAKVIKRLVHDLRATFPEMKGFSRANVSS